MKRIFFVAISLIAICGCGGHSHNEGAVSHEHEHGHVHNFTAYTASYEYFMQHEGLVAGEKSCITLYVTELDGFKPAEASTAEAVLKVGENVQNVKAAAGHKGIFHFDLVPGTAGDGVLVFSIGGEKAHFHIDVHSHGEEHNHSCDTHSADEHNHSAHNHSDGHSHEHHSHAVHQGASHSHAGHGEATEGKPGDVAFSKEQSWKVEFETAIAGESDFAAAVKVAAKVEAAPANFTTIVSTASGKVQFAGNVVEGKRVACNEALFYLEGGDVTDNDAAVKFAEAESNYEVAKADFERKKHLFIEKIVSERDYQASEAAFKQAEARFNSMKRNFGGGKVTLRSSIAGYVSALLVSNGDYVQPGTPIATVQCDGDVNVVAELPVRFAGRLQFIESVNVELASGKVCSVDELGGRVLAVGSSANGCNMIPVTISMPAVDGVFPGSIVTLYLNTGETGEKGVVVPRTALVEEMGRFFVFVQNSPISFEKRSVETGATDGKLVKLLSGVSTGERVVTKGALLLKLSQGAAAIDPHAGHVH